MIVVAPFVVLSEAPALSEAEGKDLHLRFTS